MSDTIRIKAGVECSFTTASSESVYEVGRAEWEAMTPEDRQSERHTRPACPVCRDTGIVQCPDPDRESLYETACPERVHAEAATAAGEKE